TPEGAWKDAPNPRCLVAVKPLMWEFRMRFCQGLRQALQDETLTLPEDTTTRQWLNAVNRVNRQNWEVFIARPPEDGGPTSDDILRYQAEDVAGGPLSGDRLATPQRDLSETQLAYLKSVPLSVSRLEDAPEEEVWFRWGAYDPTTGTRERTQLERLPIDAFLRRYLQHIPPPHYQTVRHYGLYTSAKREAHARCRAILVDRQPPPPSDLPVNELESDTDTWMAAHTCPVCGQPLIVIAHLPSIRTGHVLPRLPLGPVFAHPPPSGGLHAS
ncbi:MAG: hypothetical protein GY700_16260, partial [Propionibacteriaceae bacterium]|nr:hypothetical protein [Propionibacteriaceae bacterium]